MLYPDFGIAQSRSALFGCHSVLCLITLNCGILRAAMETWSMYRLQQLLSRTARIAHIARRRAVRGVIKFRQVRESGTFVNRLQE
jgi:hypothetical protein